METEGDYERKVLVESAISKYKRIIDETLFSEKNEKIEKKISAKINILNKVTMMNRLKASLVDTKLFPVFIGQNLIYETHKYFINSRRGCDYYDIKNKR